jgi:hypothetical protein
MYKPGRQETFTVTFKVIFHATNCTTTNKDAVEFAREILNKRKITTLLRNGPACSTKIERELESEGTVNQGGSTHV